ncbi:MAG: hypothetical protein COA78_06170 [Blastopirellula sp.]|nr:MAG: hypothetical protein COA78_06170 [Blastopirellula sp.]
MIYSNRQDNPGLAIKKLKSTEAQSDCYEHGAEKIIKSRINNNSIISHHLKRVGFENINDVLVISGSVPTKRLKQVLINYTRDLKLYYEIDHQVDVISSTGLSHLTESMN